MAQPALCVMARTPSTLRKLLEQIGAMEALGDVLAGAGRAVDGADDGDVIASAVALMFRPIRPAIEAEEGTIFSGGGRGGGQSRQKA